MAETYYNSKAVQNSYRRVLIRKYYIPPGLCPKVQRGGPRGLCYGYILSSLSAGGMLKVTMMMCPYVPLSLSVSSRSVGVLLGVAW